MQHSLALIYLYAKLLDLNDLSVLSAELTSFLYHPLTRININAS
jgi:hypothetical protein